MQRQIKRGSYSLQQSEEHAKVKDVKEGFVLFVCVYFMQCVPPPAYSLKVVLCTQLGGDSAYLKHSASLCD